MKTIQEIRNIIETTKARSAWDRGVNTYALELLEEYEWNYGADACAPSEADLLDGASSWKEYSWGGCSLIYDGDIAQRLCKSHRIEKDPQRRKEAQQPGRMAGYSGPRTVPGSTAHQVYCNRLIGGIEP